jgi:hypothetical protein
MNLRDILKISSVPVVVASLCCLSPVILVAFGLSTVGFAASLSDIFYGQYKWWFRLAGLLLLALSFIYYLRRTKGVCTLDEAKKRRTEIINIAAFALIVGVVGYLVFLYVIVHYAGVFLAIWE